MQRHVAGGPSFFLLAPEEGLPAPLGHDRPDAADGPGPSDGPALRWAVVSGTDHAAVRAALLADGRAIDINPDCVPVDVLVRLGFRVDTCVQRPGDVVVLPLDAWFQAEACADAPAIATLLSWTRFCASTIAAAFDGLLPSLHDVLAPDQSMIKSIIAHSVRALAADLAADPDPHPDRVADLARLVPLFGRMLDAEWIEAQDPDQADMASSDRFAAGLPVFVAPHSADPAARWCSFCRCHLWNRALECPILLADDDFDVHPSSIADRLPVSRTRRHSSDDRQDKQKDFFIDSAVPIESVVAAFERINHADSSPNIANDRPPLPADAANAAAAAAAAAAAQAFAARAAEPQTAASLTTLPDPQGPDSADPDSSEPESLLVDSDAESRRGAAFQLCFDCYAKGRSCSHDIAMKFVQAHPMHELIDEYKRAAETVNALINRLTAAGSDLPAKLEPLAVDLALGSPQCEMQAGTITHRLWARRQSPTTLYCHQCKISRYVHQQILCPTCKQATAVRRKGHYCVACLWNRYGENMYEILRRREWACPLCMRICNCSTCLRERGIRDFALTTDANAGLKGRYILTLWCDDPHNRGSYFDTKLIQLMRDGEKASMDASHKRSRTSSSHKRERTRELDIHMHDILPDTNGGEQDTGGAASRTRKRRVSTGRLRMPDVPPMTIPRQVPEEWSPGSVTTLLRRHSINSPDPLAPVLTSAFGPASAVSAGGQSVPGTPFITSSSLPSAGIRGTASLATPMLTPNPLSTAAPSPVPDAAGSHRTLSVSIVPTAGGGEARERRGHERRRTLSKSMKLGDRSAQPPVDPNIRMTLPPLNGKHPLVLATAISFLETFLPHQEMQLIYAEMHAADFYLPPNYKWLYPFPTDFGSTMLDSMRRADSTATISRGSSSSSIGAGSGGGGGTSAGSSMIAIPRSTQPKCSCSACVLSAAGIASPCAFASHGSWTDDPQSEFNFLRYVYESQRLLTEAGLWKSLQVFSRWMQAREITIEHDPSK
ncbi:hypothetical protein HK105_201099 [Polyrhizophydium stewartii]|uniref:Zinc-finger domain-containing protein n=1 Tax=Polyrhizophydium stewartii TaxID=2732419 RepID=A0ABR4NIU4_9FUNG